MSFRTRSNRITPVNPHHVRPQHLALIESAADKIGPVNADLAGVLRDLVDGVLWSQSHNAHHADQAQVEVTVSRQVWE